MKTYIVNIQRFSLNDGPGIRTTVFLQGCNMRCAWCHNPETISAVPVQMHYKDKCVGCGHCADGCQSGARVMSSREMGVEDVMREIRQDKLYYDNSEGGVTISGGEPMLHADFVSELADACHKEGIRIACETNMSLPWVQVESVLKKMDLIMCDMKVNATVEHRKLTGIDNQVVFNNIGRSSKLGIPMIVRTPLIPGATDMVENLKPIAEYIAKMDNILYYELLNFNPLGATKCEALGLRDQYADAKPLSKQQLEGIRLALAEVKGISVRVA